MTMMDPVSFLKQTGVHQFDEANSLVLNQATISSICFIFYVFSMYCNEDIY